MKDKLFTLPNTLTLANLACGCVATVCALSPDAGRGAHDAFFWFIAAAAVFDLLDGAAARLTGSYSEIGKQLDSLADMVSFGVAPSAALFAIYSGAGAMWGGTPELYHALRWTMFAVALFAALRLARFNVDDTQREEFTGLPSPAAGLAIAALCTMGDGSLFFPREVCLAVAVVASLLMVSPVRMFSLKFKNFGWRENRLRYVFLASSVVFVALLGIGGIAAAIGLYAAIGLVRHLTEKRTVEKI
ncbi:MAG: CDP-diacylglycerol--serine O-phosphatidyltransferase [Alistipes sp.]|jgi:CDP-diacylglycerol--serine O-phosphatidyltransferase|nr:CDP-diacylglycerol--serine O-phosphatidyltransferase [Alistipes sp.]